LCDLSPQPGEKAPSDLYHPPLAECLTATVQKKILHLSSQGEEVMIAHRYILSTAADKEQLLHAYSKA
jgi:hypothetical protein